MLATYNKRAGVFPIRSALFGLVLAALVAPLSQAAELVDLQVAELPGERAEVRLKFADTPVEPQGYSIEQPARVVLDFQDTENRLTQKKFPISIGEIDSAVVVSGGNRTRVIVNMQDLSTYSTRMDGNHLVVSIGGGSSGSGGAKAAPTVPAAAAPGPSSAEPSSPVEGVAITNIDFRRGETGEGRVIVDLSDPSVGVDIKEAAGGVEINFLNAAIPQALRRKLDVTDFATPVTQVSAAKEGKNAVLSVAATGEYEYLAYQADDRYVLSVKPLTEKEQAEREAKFAYVGEKLSLNFQDIAVRNVLQIIADFNNLNLVASDTVQGSITLRLDNVPWDQALDLVLKTKGLDKRQIGNVLLVAPAAEIAERERQELQTQKQLQELAPLRTEYIRIRYANAGELFKLFVGEGGGSGSGGPGGGATGSILSERGSAIVDERTNSIILTDTENKIQEFRRLIEQVDIPIRQVMIEARIVIANTDFEKRLGVRWGGVGRDQLNGDKTITFSGAEETNAVVDLGVFRPTGSLAMGIIGQDFMLDMELSALEDGGFAEIVSQPKVITGDKQSASISSGTEIPYQEASASGATTTSFKEAVLKLDVTPQITPDNNIIMDLVINQDSVGALNAGSGIPTIDVTELETQVLVSDGQTVVLGGIYQTEQVTSERKVPVLGDVPFLGRFFRNDVTVDNRNELLIFITPRLMDTEMANSY